MGKFKVRRLYLVLSLCFLMVFFSILLFIYASKLEFVQAFNKPKDNGALTAENLVEICENNFNWRDCYGRQLGVVNYQLKIPQTLELLKQIQQIDGRTRDCHLIAHRIATSEVEKIPWEWINIFDYVDQTTCNNGFVHGVMEGRSKFDSELVLDAKTIPAICNQIEEKTSARVGKSRQSADDACAHIMGHILLAQDEGVIKQAVETCGKVPADIRRSCFDGIFMENILRENLEAHEIASRFALTKAASLGLEENCRQYDGEAGLSCWRELAHIYTSFTKNDPHQVYDLCYQSEKADYALECFMHSINLMVLSDAYSSEDLANTCDKYWGQEKETNNCISRTIAPLMGSSVDYIDKAEDFCSAAPDMYKKFCYTRIGGELATRTSPEKRRQLCKIVPGEYLDYCIRGD